MNRKIFAVVLGAVGVAAVSTAVPAAATGASGVSVDELIPVLHQLQVSSDVVPPDVDLDTLGGINPESVRVLGSDAAATYWVGEYGQDGVCLVARLADDSGLAASACADVSEFYRSGLSLAVGGGSSDSNWAEAYLLPPDVDSSKISSVLETPTADARAHDASNLVTVSQSNSHRLEEREIERTGGSEFHFAPLRSQN